MVQSLPVIGFATMFTTITQKVEILRTSANQLLNEAEELNNQGKIKEASAKIAQARAKIEEAERLSGKVIRKRGKR